MHSNSFRSSTVVGIVSMIFIINSSFNLDIFKPLNFLSPGHDIKGPEGNFMIVEMIVDFIVMCLFMACVVTGLFMFFRPVIEGVV